MLAVGSDARALMTADIELTSTSAFSPTEISAIEAAIKASTIVDGQNEVITSSAMAQPADDSNPNTKLIELKGIEPPFPLVGDFKMADGKPFEFALLENNGVVVAQILLEELAIKIGDNIRIGEAVFKVTGSFDEEPGGTGGFRLGARVFVKKDAFDSAGIIKNASRVRRRILYRTTTDPTPLVESLRLAVKGTNITVQSYRETQERMSRQFERTENYLALTGLLILVLGGIGVWNVARAFVEQKRLAVAILKCLGAGGNVIIAVYMLQILVLGMLGSLFGVAMAQAALWLAEYNFADSLPAKMTYTINLNNALQGMLLGVIISVIFSALPLLGVKNIKPRLLLHDQNNEKMRKLDPFRLIFGTIGISVLLALAVWQAGSFRVGVSFLIGLSLTSFALYFSAYLLTKLLSRTRTLGGFSFRQAINSLYRPGNQTRIILLAVGLGAFVVLSVQALQNNLVREFDFSRNAKLPSLFFIDIQKSQLDELTQLLNARTGETAEQTPTVRARIAFINGKPVDFSETKIRREQGIIGREFAVTYRPNMDENESLIAGDWWITAKPSDVPEVSVEEDMAKQLNIGLGDSVTFNISGRDITARVANIRTIDLRNTRTAFVFVFRPGFLEQAPQNYAATILKKIGATERQRLQRDVIEKFPNIQIFDVADIVETVQKLINNFVLAISFVGGFVILSGILILIGSIALTRSQRIYENAVMKTLGAKRGILTKILVTEYSLLGILAGIIGSSFAALLSYAMCKYVLEIGWQFDAQLFVIGIVATGLLVNVVGVAASYGILFRKPLSTLRGQ